jgi:CDP-diacylglycerol--serine O-phosphatidyltransferase
MKIKSHIPNIFTLLNLLAGTIAAMLAVSDRLLEAAILVLFGIFFDFFDGLFARLLKVQGELGKQLDSLADVVTSGVVPGIVMFQLLMKSIHRDWLEGLSCEIGNWMSFEDTKDLNWEGYSIHLLPLIGLLLTLAAAYRLANFNIDERQTTSFIGLPTPAMALFIVSLPVILKFNTDPFLHNLILNKYTLISLVFIFSLLMNIELPLFSLKLKSFSFKTSWVQILFIILSILSLILFKIVAIPIIIIIYIVLSIIHNMLNKLH